MFEQLQQTFSKIDQDVVLNAWERCNKNVEETKALLIWITENTTNLQQQHHLMIFFQEFGNKLKKTTILQTWKNCNTIFVDTHEKLKEICATSNLNELNVNKIYNKLNKYNIIYDRLKEENELKIYREICLHILWNILKYPKHIKYRQINKQALYNYLFQKCHTLGTDCERVFIGMEGELQHIGFKKGYDDNWYYQYDHIQLLHLWNCYQSVITLQTMYLMCVLINQMV
ncbi:hypothetical protein RFI_32589 [Reticulomyxa filosa]|uniref:Uncharacterized protein n=1 Tax=Reticulomyxa filosa TaxID=46433 RepID=X6LTW2_RETFI|nr:hypothetical protein RFI_32589 [Reticulomyxa filosa]|eukprot:ETO04806.1 hypothetical protein RFI_32589 [Reticulomyxa filosa]